MGGSKREHEVEKDLFELVDFGIWYHQGGYCERVINKLSDEELYNLYLEEKKTDKYKRNREDLGRVEPQQGLTEYEFNLSIPFVDDIMRTDFNNIEKSILDHLNKVDKKYHKIYLIHLNRLFMNVLVNRLNEFGDDGDQKVSEVMKSINEKINKLRNE